MYGVFPKIILLCSIAGIFCNVPCKTAYQKFTHSQAKSYLDSNGIGIYSSGGCSDRNKRTCTSLDQINCKSISELVKYKKNSGCSITVTGGTETGHATGTYSHWNGYKIDISLSNCHSNYIKSKFKYLGTRPGDGAAQYKDAAGNTFASESNHWDILFP